MAGTGEEFGPCPHCGQLHAEDVLLCPTAEKLLPLEGRLLDGKFRFKRMLGEGGMGAVWKAENTLVKKDVALKLMHAQFASDEGVLARFRNEATAAGRIGSEHICDILDLGKSKLGPYIVMEMLNGKDFSHLLQERGRIDPGLAVLIVRQALIGLGAAHGVGIVHRDLKPENIFLHEPKPGRLMVKLMDFGISKFTEGDQAGKTGVGVLMGTPEYMSPEQTEGAAKVDLRTDIWAMGVILYWALAGKNPFVGPTMAATLVNVSTKTQPPLSSVAPNLDPNLVAIVDRCLAKNPADRWNSCEELSAALQPYENRNNGLYVPFDDGAGKGPPRPGATIASAGPPQSPRPGSAPTITTGGMNPATLGGSHGGPAAAPTWSNEVGRPNAAAGPTLGGGDTFGLSDADLNARPETSMGGGKGLTIVLVLVLLGALGGGGWFAYSKFAGGGGDTKTAAAASAGDDGADAAGDGGDSGTKSEGSGAAAGADESGAAAAESGGAAAADTGGAAADTGGAAVADTGATPDNADGPADDGAADDAGAGDDGAADDGGKADDGGDDGGKADDGGGGDDGGGKPTNGGGKKPPKGPDMSKVKKVGKIFALKSPPKSQTDHRGAQQACAKLKRDEFGRLSKWRLPTRVEIRSLGLHPNRGYWTDRGAMITGSGGRALGKTAGYTCVSSK